MTTKNKILLVTGIGDTYFSKNSNKKLEFGADLADKVTNFLTQSSNIYSGIINLNTHYDTIKDVDVTKNVKSKSKVISYSMFNPELFDTWNSFTLIENQNDSVEYNAKALDWILPPSNYEIHICGVDLNGFYKNVIQDLIKRGYTVYLYSDLIKRFKNTEEGISQIKNKNFVYCSHRSVRIK